MEVPFKTFCSAIRSRLRPCQTDPLWLSGPGELISVTGVKFSPSIRHGMSILSISKMCALAGGESIAKSW